MPVTKCEPGCDCKKHSRYKCAPDCACDRHNRPRMSADEAGESRQRRLAQNRAYMRERRLADPERARQEAREQYKRNGRKHNLKWKFGITPEQRDAMFTAQDGCCYLCGEPLDGRTVHIDHDRSCCRGDRSCGSCIRGLACQLCNQGIGQFADDPERMRRVADNLEMANRRLRSSGQAMKPLPVSEQPGSGTPGQDSAT